MRVADEPETVSITFKEESGSYNAGETAAFTPDQAKALVDAGVAEEAGGADRRDDPAPAPEEPRRE